MIESQKGDYLELVDNIYFMRVDTDITHTISVTIYEIIAWESNNSPFEAEEIGHAYVKFDGSIHMWLGDNNKYSHIDDADTYCKMIKSFSQICLKLVHADRKYIDDTIDIKKQVLPDGIKDFLDYCHNKKK